MDLATPATFHSSDNGEAVTSAVTQLTSSGAESGALLELARALSEELQAEKDEPGNESSSSGEEFGPCETVSRATKDTYSKPAPKAAQVTLPVLPVLVSVLSKEKDKVTLEKLASLTIVRQLVGARRAVIDKSVVSSRLPSLVVESLLAHPSADMLHAQALAALK